jgi:uncharacterized phage-associated protein
MIPNPSLEREQKLNMFPAQTWRGIVEALVHGHSYAILGGSRMATATHIAEWIVRYRDDNGAPIDPISLQKMMFYSQAFWLARYGEPLFEGRFEAWKHGPVLPRIWSAFPSDPLRHIRPKESKPQPQIDEEVEGELRNVVDFFSRHDRFTISKATHKEDPWREARGTLSPSESSNNPIPTDKIRSYYAGLLADGEDALSRHEVLDIVPEPRLGSYYQAGICVRQMIDHPFYRMDWAREFRKTVPDDEAPLPKSAYAPLTKREFVPASEL